MDNKQHICMREGSGYINGVKVLEACVIKITVTPEVWEGKKLGQRTKDRRWIGIDIKATLTEYKSTPWLSEAVKQYLDTGVTPTFTFQGIQDDGGSEYHDINGIETVTLSGAVITSEITLIDIDTDGDMVKSNIEFGANELS